MRRTRLALGALEGKQHAPTHLVGVFERFQAGRVRGPIVATEVTVGSAAGDDQVVVTDGRVVVERDRLGLRVDADDLGQQHQKILLLAQDVADRRGDQRRRQPGGRDLVQQRLEQMMVAAIDERDLDRLACKRPRRREAAETAADDDDVRDHGNSEIIVIRL